MDDEDLTPEPVNIAATLDNALNSPDPAAAIEALAPFYRNEFGRKAWRAFRDWYYLQWKHRRLRRDPRLAEANA